MMLKDLLNEVIVLVAGKPAEPIADLLNSSKHVNEFLIAKKLSITINQARNILYKISNYGLVSSIRKKDKKKGWYTYFWRLEVLKALEFLREEKLKRTSQINNQIKNRESKEFYICNRCNIEINEETALLHDFTCNECGEIFSRKDNTKMLKDLKKSLEKLSSELVLINQEISQEKEKFEKVRVKQQKKEKTEKAANRAKARKIMKAARNKLKKSKPKIKKTKKVVKKAKKKKRR